MLGFEADVEMALRDCDYGRWRGLALTDVAALEPDRFAAWLSVGLFQPDPEFDLTMKVGREVMHKRRKMLRHMAKL